MKVWITEYALTDGIIEAESAEKIQTKKKLFAFWNNDEFGDSIRTKKKYFSTNSLQSKKPKKCARRKSRA